MTDEELKAKILAEIERLFVTSNVYSRTFKNGQRHALMSLKDFINSLPEELVSKVWHDASEEPNRVSILMLQFENDYHKPTIANPIEGDFPWGKVVEINRISKWAYLDDLLKANIVKQEESVTKDLKKEIEAYCLKHGYISKQEIGYTMQEQVADIAMYFYNLGRQKENNKEVSNT